MALYDSNDWAFDEIIINFDYKLCMLFSFLTCLLIHHILSPYVFGKYNQTYASLPRSQRMEWDSR